MALIRPKNIPTANLSGTINSNQVPQLDHTKMPAGSVIQVVYGRHIEGTDRYDLFSTAATEADGPAQATITPLYANSKLLVKIEMHTRIAGAEGVAGGIKRDGVKLAGQFHGGNTNYDFFYKGEDLNHHYTLHMEVWIDAGSTSATTFRPYAYGWGTGAWEISYGFGEHKVNIFEIKQ